MSLRVSGPLLTRKVRKLGAWTRPGNAWNGGESVGLIGGLIGGACGSSCRRTPDGLVVDMPVHVRLCQYRKARR